MKNKASLLFGLIIFVLYTTNLSATTVDQELDRIAGEVAGLKLGFGTYILGSSLNDSQKKMAARSPVDKAMQGTHKFQDGEVFVVVSSDNGIILGIYKEYPEATRKQMKSIIGDLMFRHGEPTAMAHDKIVYWTYNKSGKISQDEFDFARQSGGAESLVTVKLSSSGKIFTEKEEDNTISSVYVMITSDPLSKLFLAKGSSNKVTKK
ncbi:hypothetical protein [Desulfopila sp. IMCC35008]|uniref:hypothetical protein n=1 Tax=Desulfopila sp. IMCC35008 TaxID=2653858 RepID=UPI0013D1D6C6|nr:hypothetical protein [Desulfopila sp. IMCC35008]